MQTAERPTSRGLSLPPIVKDSQGPHETSRLACSHGIELDTVVSLRPPHNEPQPRSGETGDIGGGGFVFAPAPETRTGIPTTASIGLV